MKRAYIALTVVCMLALAGASFAQEGGMGPGGMQGGQQMMMQRPSPQMESTPDGGVIVMLGNKLYKYDKDLKLVNEVELKTEQKQSQKK